MLLFKKIGVNRSKWQTARFNYFILIKNETKNHNFVQLIFYHNFFVSSVKRCIGLHENGVQSSKRHYKLSESNILLISL